LSGQALPKNEQAKFQKTSMLQYPDLCLCM